MIYNLLHVYSQTSTKDEIDDIRIYMQLHTWQQNEHELKQIDGVTVNVKYEKNIRIIHSLYSNT